MEPSAGEPGNAVGVAMDLVVYALVPAAIGAVVLVLLGLRNDEYSRPVILSEGEEDVSSTLSGTPAYLKALADFFGGVLVGFFAGWVCLEWGVQKKVYMVVCFCTAIGWVATAQTLRNRITVYVLKKLQAVSLALRGQPTDDPQ